VRGLLDFVRAELSVDDAPDDLVGLHTEGRAKAAVRASAERRGSSAEEREASSGKGRKLRVTEWREGRGYREHASRWTRMRAERRGGSRQVSWPRNLVCGRKKANLHPLPFLFVDSDGCIACYHSEPVADPSASRQL
jgi:hypothetical protein